MPLEGKDHSSKTRSAEGMAGIAKGMAIIESFSAQRPKLTIADAAEATGQTRATARRCLLSLQELGYVKFDGKYFHPAPQLMRLGYAFLSSQPLLQIAQTIIEDVQDAAGEGISLSIFEDDHIVHIARSSNGQRFLPGTSVGMRAPAYCTAAGRVWLAAMSAEELSIYFKRVSLERYSEVTVIDRRKLALIISETQQQDYGINLDELETGLCAISVPVRNSRGVLCATMTASASSVRASQEKLVERFLPHLREGARLLGMAY